MEWWDLISKCSAFNLVCDEENYRAEKRSSFFIFVIIKNIYEVNISSWLLLIYLQHIINFSATLSVILRLIPSTVTRTYSFPERKSPQKTEQTNEIKSESYRAPMESQVNAASHLSFLIFHLFLLVRWNIQTLSRRLTKFISAYRILVDLW